MALQSLISFELTADEDSIINEALSKVQMVLEGKVVNLTPEERGQYGRIANRTENWIDKVKAHMDANANLIPVYIDKPEHDKDYTARQVLKPILNKLSQLHEMVEDTQKLIGFDIYVNSLAFYKNLKLASDQNVPGSTGIYQDLKAQFPQRGKKPPKDGTDIGTPPPLPVQ